MSVGWIGNCVGLVVATMEYIIKALARLVTLRLRIKRCKNHNLHLHISRIHHAWTTWDFLFRDNFKFHSATAKQDSKLVLSGLHPSMADFLPPTLFYGGFFMGAMLALPLSYRLFG